MQNARDPIPWRRRFPALSSVNVGNDKTPHRVGTTISDVATGVYAFQAIATALFARATVGTGRWIDVNLAQSTAALLGHKVAGICSGGRRARALNVPAGSYQTRDGWMMVTLVNEAQYKRLCAAIERDDLASDPRFADFAGRADQADVLISQMREVFLSQSTETWLRQAACGGHHRRAQILNPATGCTTLHVEATKAAVCQDTPRLGRYTPRARRVLPAFPRTGCAPRQISEPIAARFCLEAGFDRDAIDDLIKSGAVRTSVRRPIPLNRPPVADRHQNRPGFALVATTEDCQEGLDTFVEKRPPNDTGR